MLVQVSGQYTRVIADPRAERVGGADWVDPDTLPAEEGAAIGPAPIGEADEPEPAEEPPRLPDSQ